MKNTLMLLLLAPIGVLLCAYWTIRVSLVPRNEPQGPVGHYTGRPIR